MNSSRSPAQRKTPRTKHNKNMNTLYILNTGFLKEPGVYEKALLKLNNERREKAESYKPESSRLLSVGASLLIDLGLREYSLTLKDSEFVYNEFGKPAVKEREDIAFSISHSGEYAVAMFTNEQVGVDIERIKHPKESVVKFTLSAGEALVYNNSPDSEKDALFFKFWTEKESFLKFLGTGINVRPAEIPTLYKLKLSDVHFYTFDVVPGYVITVCSKGPEPDVKIIKGL